VKDTLGRLLHFGAENNALQGEIIDPNFLFGSHLHCCSNILVLATELQIDQKGSYVYCFLIEEYCCHRVLKEQNTNYVK
jgi:hypothetical protein